MNISKSITDFVKLYRDKKIIICGHESPDADSTSSQFALQFLLQKLGMPNVYCVKQKKYQENLQPLLTELPTIDIEDIDKNSLLICVDCSALRRISKDVSNVISKVVLQIDHHASNENYAEINLVEEYASATAEIISSIFLDLKITPSLPIARLLYAGIISDSRSFSLPMITEKTFDIAKWLLGCGVETSHIHNLVFNSEPIEKINLIKALYDRIELFSNGKICVGVIFSKDIKKINANDVDKTGLLEKLLLIKNVEIALTIVEMKNYLKVNIRSLSMNYNLNEIAEFYGGGGHFEASAFIVKNKSIKDLKTELIKDLESRLLR